MGKLKRIIIIGVMVSNKRIILYRIIGRGKKHNPSRPRATNAVPISYRIINFNLLHVHFSLSPITLSTSAHPQ